MTQGGRNSTDRWVGGEPGRVAESEDADSFVPEPEPGTPRIDDVPAIVRCRANDAGAARADDVESLLAKLEQAAIALFPKWLPDAALFEGPEGGAVAAVRVLAAQVAEVSEHYGPYLTDLSEHALRSRGGAASDRRETVAPRSKYSAAIRAAELARVIAAAHQCPSAVVVIEVPAGLSERAEQALTAAAEWIARHGAWRIGLDTTDRTDPRGDRHRPEPEAPCSDSGHDIAQGTPRPDSPAELALEAALRAQPWAVGRVWNQAYQSSPLAPVYRLDLWWQAERCVVEIDGSEHRTAEHYAADRRRDVQLQLDGQSVLRFTNDDVLTDVTDVVARIERLVRGRRSEHSYPHPPERSRRARRPPAPQALPARDREPHRPHGDGPRADEP